MLYVIVAHDDKGGIGSDGGIPWSSSVDMKHFRQITSDCLPGKPNALIMGSVTYGTLVKNRFGANRRIMMVGKEGYSSVRGAINDCGEMGKIFICGGQRVYEEALSMDTDVTIYSSHIRGDYGCDRFVSLPGGGEIIYEDEDMTIKMNILRYNVQA